MSARDRKNPDAGPLSPAEVNVLELVAQHRLLSTSQVDAIRGRGASKRWTLALLSGLARRGLLSHVPARGQRRLWHVTERGARLARAGGSLSGPPRVLGAEEASGALQAHTLAVNEVGICFLRAARGRGDEFGPLSWRHEVAHPLTWGRGQRRRQLIADALLTYLLVEDQRVSLQYRLLELDRATLSVDRLAAKLAAYARLYRAADERGEPAWRAWYPTFPAVLVVLAGGERAALERRRRTAAALVRADPELARAPEVAILACLLEDLRREGPFAPIFLDPSRPGRALDWLGEAAGATSGDERAGR